jgi:hypothetical protein
LPHRYFATAVPFFDYDAAARAYADELDQQAPAD